MAKREKIYLTAYPHLIAEWHPTKNWNLDPAKVTHGSGKKVWWVCRAGHEWVARVNARTSVRGCPVCAGQRTLAGFNDLATTHPELSKEWSPINEFGPESVSAGSNKIVWWVCPLEHTWQTTVASRALHGKGCPKCCLNQTSKIEAELHRLLSEEFSDAEQDFRIGPWRVDVALGEEKVAVEYDGAYFHSGSLDRDSRKTVDLLGRGYRVIRIRERSRRYTLPSLDIEDSRYLELTYDYSNDWLELPDTLNRITDWILNV